MRKLPCGSSSDVVYCCLGLIPNPFNCASVMKPGVLSREFFGLAALPPETVAVVVMPETPEDFRDLIERVRQGSDEAVRELVDKYGESLRRTIRRVLNRRLRSKFDTQDFVQWVWNSLFRVRDSMDRFDYPEQLAAYLVAMARNKVGIEVRRRLQTEKRDVRREIPLDTSLLGDQPGAVSPFPAPVDAAIARERWDRLLKGQPEHYRQILLLRLEGHTQRAIADRLGLDESTVRRFLKRLSDGAGS